MVVLENVILLVEAMNQIHDPYEGSHGRHTAAMAESVAKMMDLPPELMELVDASAKLHDIGKIFIPENILNKLGELTDLEWSSIQQHTVLGAEVFRAYGKFPQIEEVILHHHENYDGSGYPSGLKGEAIPILARLVRVIDSFDALRTKRAYRNAISSAEALAIMEEHKEWFDPQIFELFKKQAMPVKAVE